MTSPIHHKVCRSSSKGAVTPSRLSLKPTSSDEIPQFGLPLISQFISSPQRNYDNDVTLSEIQTVTASLEQIHAACSDLLHTTDVALAQYETPKKLLDITGSNREEQSEHSFSGSKKKKKRNLLGDDIRSDPNFESAKKKAEENAADRGGGKSSLQKSEANNNSVTDKEPSIPEQVRSALKDLAYVGPCVDEVGNTVVGTLTEVINKLDEIRKRAGKEEAIIKAQGQEAPHKATNSVPYRSAMKGSRVGTDGTVNNMLPSSQTERQNKGPNLNSSNGVEQEINIWPQITEAQLALQDIFVSTRKEIELYSKLRERLGVYLEKAVSKYIHCGDKPLIGKKALIHSAKKGKSESMSSSNDRYTPEVIKEFGRLIIDQVESFTSEAFQNIRSSCRRAVMVLHEASFDYAALIRQRNTCVPYSPNSNNGKQDSSNKTSRTTSNAKDYSASNPMNTMTITPTSGSKFILCVAYDRPKRLRCALTCSAFDATRSTFRSFLKAVVARSQSGRIIAEDKEGMAFMISFNCGIEVFFFNYCLEKYSKYLPWPEECIALPFCGEKTNIASKSTILMTESERKKVQHQYFQKNNIDNNNNSVNTSIRADPLKVGGVKDNYENSLLDSLDNAHRDTASFTLNVAGAEMVYQQLITNNNDWVSEITQLFDRHNLNSKSKDLNATGSESSKSQFMPTNSEKEGRVTPDGSETWISPTERNKGHSARNHSVPGEGFLGPTTKSKFTLYEVKEIKLTRSKLLNMEQMFASQCEMINTRAEDRAQQQIIRENQRRARDGLDIMNSDSVPLKDNDRNMNENSKSFSESVSQFDVKERTKGDFRGDYNEITMDFNNDKMGTEMGGDYSIVSSITKRSASIIASRISSISGTPISPIVLSEDEDLKLTVVPKTPRISEDILSPAICAAVTAIHYSAFLFRGPQFRCAVHFIGEEKGQNGGISLDSPVNPAQAAVSAMCGLAHTVSEEGDGVSLSDRIVIGSEGANENDFENPTSLYGTVFSPQVFDRRETKLALEAIGGMMQERKCEEIELFERDRIDEFSCSSIGIDPIETRLLCAIDLQEYCLINNVYSVKWKRKEIFGDLASLGSHCDYGLLTLEQDKMVTYQHTVKNQSYNPWWWCNLLPSIGALSGSGGYGRLLATSHRSQACQANIVVEDVTNISNLVGRGKQLKGKKRNTKSLTSRIDADQSQQNNTKSELKTKSPLQLSRTKSTDNKSNKAASDGSCPPSPSSLETDFRSNRLTPVPPLFYNSEIHGQRLLSGSCGSLIRQEMSRQKSSLGSCSDENSVAEIGCQTRCGGYDVSIPSYDNGQILLYSHGKGSSIERVESDKRSAHSTIVDTRSRVEDSTQNIGDLQELFDISFVRYLKAAEPSSSFEFLGHTGLLLDAVKVLYAWSCGWITENATLAFVSQSLLGGKLPVLRGSFMDRAPQQTDDAQRSGAGVLDQVLECLAKKYDSESIAASSGRTNNVCSRKSVTRVRAVDESVSFSKRKLHIADRSIPQGIEFPAYAEVTSLLSAIKVKIRRAETLYMKRMSVCNFKTCEDISIQSFIDEQLWLKGVGQVGTMFDQPSNESLEKTNISTESTNPASSNHNHNNSKAASSYVKQMHPAWNQVAARYTDIIDSFSEHPSSTVSLQSMANSPDSKSIGSGNGSGGGVYYTEDAVVAKAAIASIFHIFAQYQVEQSKLREMQRIIITNVLQEMSTQLIEAKHQRNILEGQLFAKDAGMASMDSFLFPSPKENI